MKAVQGFLIVFLCVCVASALQAGCPQACTCNLDISMSWLTCSGNGKQAPAETWSELTEVVHSNPLLKQLSYHWGLAELPDNIAKFEGLMLLNLSQNYMKTLGSNAFSGMKRLRTLDLGFNALDKIDAHAFNGLEELRTLNLSHNRIASLQEGSFNGLYNLRILTLKQNRIPSLSQGIFKDLQSLEILDLSYNHVTFLSSKHFESLQRLKRLYLNSNLVQSIHYDAVLAMSHIPVLDLSNNPLDCSCAVSPFKESIDKGTTKLVQANSTTCATPKALAGVSLGALEEDELNCTSPAISFISDPQIIPYQHDLYLPCQVEGMPAPAVIWVTPWGHKFAHKSGFHLIGDKSLDLHSHHSYQAKNLILISQINLFENGTLHISKFRGYFAGNYTCIALNPEGNSSATVAVDIYHFLKVTYYQSLFMSGYASSSFFVFGIIVGSLRMLWRIIHRKLKAKKQKQEEAEKVVSVSDIVVILDENDDRSDPSPPKTPLLSPTSSTPESARKCTTPTEGQPGWLPANIFDQLDEARWRLRYGVGRRIEKVRSHVQSIRESSTLYMQSIRESGSSAANRVRTGIVFSVETMKYSVQSLREFCGTGDMRGQTISMISVSTDVDTEQRSEVIRSVTFV